MSDKDGKTEDATPKRLKEARDKGQIPKSQDLNAAVSLVVFTALIGTWGNYLLTNSYNTMHSMLAIDYTGEFNLTIVKSMLLEGILKYFVIFIPFALIAVILGLVVNLAQTRLIFTTDPLKPDFSKLNPVQGFKNMFSKKAMLTLLKNLIKLIIVFRMSFNNVMDNFNKILNSGNIGSEKLFFFFIEFLKEVTMNVVMVMFVLGVLDYFMEYREHKKNLKMTKEEVKEEMKEQEGNPEMKGARQQRQREISMGRMMESIPESTAVVTNPTHIAVAIRYEQEIDESPVVVAKGAGFIAEKIRERAKESDIPIIENKPLARNMYKEIEIGDNVPVEMYQAVAEILAIVYEMEEKNKGKI